MGPGLARVPAGQPLPTEIAENSIFGSGHAPGKRDFPLFGAKVLSPAGPIIKRRRSTERKMGRHRKVGSSGLSFYLRTEWWRDFLDRKHLSQGDFAAKLGVSRSHWSQLLNRRRSLSVRMRQRLLGMRLLRGVAEVEMWGPQEADW